MPLHTQILCKNLRIHKSLYYVAYAFIPPGAQYTLH